MKAVLLINHGAPEKLTMRRSGYVYGDRNDARGAAVTAPKPRAADGKLSEVS